MSFKDWDANLTAEGETLWVKVHGISADVAAGATHTFEYVCDYAKALYNGTEVFHDVKAQTDLQVEVPNPAPPDYVVYEQFGFDVCVGEMYKRECPYAATVVQYVKLKCTVTNHDTVTKKMGVNFLIHEVRAPS